MHIRPMEEKDVEAVYEIESQTFTLPWSKKAILQDLRDSTTYYIVAEDEEQIVGYGGLWNVVGEGQITNIAVHPSRRGEKIGKQLVQALIQYAKEEKLFLMVLEVRESNLIAQNLYCQFGFTKIGMRKNYYKQPTENAILLGLELE